jgi:hypothetical protein
VLFDLFSPLHQRLGYYLPAMKHQQVEYEKVREGADVTASITV